MPSRSTSSLIFSDLLPERSEIPRNAAATRQRVPAREHDVARHPRGPPRDPPARHLEPPRVPRRNPRARSRLARRDRRRRRRRWRRRVHRWRLQGRRDRRAEQLRHLLRPQVRPEVRGQGPRYLRRRRAHDRRHHGPPVRVRSSPGVHPVQRRGAQQDLRVVVQPDEGHRPERVDLLARSQRHRHEEVYGFSHRVCRSRLPHRQHQHVAVDALQQGRPRLLR